MVISNYLLSPTLKIPCGFLAWCVLVKFNAKPRNYE